MHTFEQQRTVVVGLGLSGKSAAQQLCRAQARVTVLDDAETPSLRAEAEALRLLGATVLLGGTVLPEEPFDLAVVSPGVPPSNPVLVELRRRGVPIIGELELGYRLVRCLNVSITGTNGKTTTTELVERVLNHAHRKTIAAGNIGRPICSVVDESHDLDFLTLEVSSFQLETIQYFRPVVAVLLNLTPDHLDRYSGMEDYIRAKARLFENQQAFDWAIIQSEALAMMRRLGINIPSKIITFSAFDREADLHADRGLLVSRLPDWSGPLLDMSRCRLQGPHNAENLMATLALGRVLRLPLAAVLEALTTYTPAPHRCELVAEVGGVQFVNDSKATNVDAVAKALQTMPAGLAGGANVYLLAGGKDKGFDYHDLGPLLSRRVKGAFLFGETREKIRAAWGLFTPCTVVDSLLEAVREAARQAVAGDVVLLSPACSSFDQFRNYQHRGEVFREAVQQWQAAGSETNRPDGGEVHPA